MTIKCPKCQHDNPEDTIYCGKCGTQLVPIKDVSVTKILQTLFLSPGKTISGKSKKKP